MSLVTRFAALIGGLKGRWDPAKLNNDLVISVDGSVVTQTTTLGGIIGATKPISGVSIITIATHNDPGNAATVAVGIGNAGAYAAGLPGTTNDAIAVHSGGNILLDNNVTGSSGFGGGDNVVTMIVDTAAKTIDFSVNGGAPSGPISYASMTGSGAVYPVARVRDTTGATVGSATISPY